MAHVAATINSQCACEWKCREAVTLLRIHLVELMKSVLQLDRPLHLYLELCPFIPDLIVKPTSKKKKKKKNYTCARPSLCMSL